MINKRLSHQIQEIKQYRNHFLILEGNINEVQFTNKNAIRGFILSIINEHKIPIIYSESPEETAKFLKLFAKKSKTEMNLRANKKSLDIKT